MHNYLHRKSVHPEKLKKTIPYGQALRIRRICTTEEDFDSGCKDLYNDFLKRGYTQDEVSAHIQKAKDVPRETTLISKEIQALTRIPLVLTYNPTLPPIMESIKKHWHILQSDTSHREIFKELPIIPKERKHRRYPG